MLKMIMNYRDRSDWVWSMIKTRHNNDVVDHTYIVYAKTKTELYRDLFDQERFIMKTRQDSDVTHRTSAIYAKNDNELS